MTQSNPSPDLTPKHIRAARALLAWSQQDLAKAARVATSTVADFERGHRTPVPNNAQAIRGALEGAGIRFLPTGAVIGPALPGIATAERPGMPMRWVSAEELSNWANLNEGVFSLPTLLAHLIRATHGSAATLRLPSDEGMRHSGWDGITRTETASTYVPQGSAGWEIGAQRSKIREKAMEDYEKRTREPVPLDPATAAFVFVTPRHWSEKEKWAKARQDEGVWREVRALDANDLVHWIEQTPAVGLWLAARLGKRPAGLRELDELWEEWSLATSWPLTEALVLSDRDQDAAEVLRWLRQEPSVLSLQATTAEEVAAFFHATLNMLPDEVAAAYRARCLVATTSASARTFVYAPAPLILLLTEPDPGLAQSLAGRGHHVIQAYDERSHSRGQVRVLARPSREGIAAALTAAGIAEPRAQALARDSARNLAVLRRLIENAPGRLPRWVQETPPRGLLAVLLAGGWDENNEADCALLAEIADQPYEAVVTALTFYVGDFDSPLKKIGATWRIASPQDAWFLLAHHLTNRDITRFEGAAHAVLSSADPRFKMEPSERWKAEVRGVRPDYSGMLRHGVGQVLILLALWGDRVRTVPDAKRRADAIVEKLLRNADQQRWWSLSGEFRLLAEASPSAFMNAIEESLDEDALPIRALFGSDEGGVFGTENLSDLLWALESLAWSPELMSRVTHLLARLDAIDNPPGRHGNRPANSLKEIHSLWNPQTHATLDQRLRALDLIRSRENGAAWKLMLALLPTNHDISMPSPLPLWRDFTVDTVETVTYGLIGRGASAITERLLADVGLSATRWSQLLERFANLVPNQEAGLAALEQAERTITDQAARAEIWATLRQVLHHHRQFPDAEWSMSTAVLQRLEVIYHRFEPADPLERVAWLFGSSVALPNPSLEGWEAEEREVDTARQKAVQALFAEGGVTRILALARRVEVAGYLGKALYESGISDPDLETVLKAALQSDDAHEQVLAHGLIVSAFADRREPWATNLLAKAESEAWGDTALLTILHALPFQRWTWERAAKAGPEIDALYWRRAPVHWMNGKSDEVAGAIRRLIDIGRARDALPLVGRRQKVDLPSDLLVELLQEAAHQPFEGNRDANAGTMFQYHVSEIFQTLDGRSDVDNKTLIALEWRYLRVLEHSPRPTKALLRALAEDPSLFIQLLSAVFKPSEGSGVVEEEPKDPEQARAVANQAYELLGRWDCLPGTRNDGSIDGEVLEAWIKEARSLAKAAGREDIANSRIGYVLSASPIGTDGTWPAEAVRDALDLFRNRAMIEGFWIGRRNRRGVTRRMPRDGGNLEREEAAKYRNWAKNVACDHPHTAKALEMLAESYEDEARRHDENAERLDWEH